MLQSLTAQAFAEGLWTAVGESPLRVSDPLKARYLLGLDATPPSPRASQRHEAGLLPIPYFRRATPHLSRQALRELERLVSGGEVLFRDDYHNLVVNQGLNDLLNITIGGATSPGQVLTWYVGLGTNTPSNSGLTPAASDTLASHPAWTEHFTYDTAVRQPWIKNAAATTMTITNSSDAADFVIDATVTIGGSLLASVNSGTSGRLYSVGAFTAGNKVLNDNDSLAVTATFTTAAP